MEELRRVLRPGGRVAVSEELPHSGYASQRSVQRWFQEAGFRYGGRRGNPFCYSLLYFVD
jgi:ubiquinone/menaquinone biosynthesis C-methylase UbiE